MRYYLGCPIWGNKDWKGRFFSRDARPADFLSQYASVFDTVEGNTTFYGIPTHDTVKKWAHAVPDRFRFAFKFPRSISHDKRLSRAEAETAQFFEVLAPLGERLGPFFLQLPPNFDDLPVLERYLAALPAEFHYAIELRHPAFYDALEPSLNAILRSLAMDRVVFDTRRLQAHRSDDAEIRAAQRRKPKNPVRFEAIGKYPFLRYAGHPEPEKDLDGLREWAPVVARWIIEGRTPYVFMHLAPDDERAPELARMFHDQMKQQLAALGDMPEWPAEREPPRPVQLELF